MQDNNLVMVLLGVGVVFVLVIVVYNQWQIWKVCCLEVYNLFVDEILCGDGWIECVEFVLGGDCDDVNCVELCFELGFLVKVNMFVMGSVEIEVGVIGVEFMFLGDDVVFEVVEMEEVVELVLGLFELVNGVIDLLIDCIVLLYLDCEVLGDCLLLVLGKLCCVGIKQIYVEGLNFVVNVWEIICVGQCYFDV